jgi:hypothetical protein
MEQNENNQNSKNELELPKVVNTKSKPLSVIMSVDGKKVIVDAKSV